MTPLLALPAFVSTPEVNRVFNCRAEHLLAALPDASVDMFLVSPPYDKIRTYKGFTWDFERIARESYRTLKPGGVLVWVVGDGVEDGSETLTSFRQALYFKDVVGFRMHDTMFFVDPGTSFPDPSRYTQQVEYMFVLSKGKPKTVHLQTQRNKWAGDRRREDSVKLQTEPDGSKSVRKRKPVKEYGVMGNAWVIGTGHGKSTKDACAFEHPAMFPEALAERHILTWSDPGDLVVDFFGGSGTTAKMARKHNRRWMTCDSSKEYCDLMERRLALPYTPDLFSTEIA